MQPPTMPDMKYLIDAMVQHPEYQKTVQRLSSVPPSIKAVLDFSEADNTHMNSVLEKMLFSNKMGTMVNVAEGDLANQKKEQEILGIRQGISLSGYRNELKNAKSQNKWTNALGLVNTGLTGYDAWQKNKEAGIVTEQNKIKLQLLKAEKARQGLQ